MAWLVFFFQAEDGIRDLVRSRGLGDVYKRQLLPKQARPQTEFALPLQSGALGVEAPNQGHVPIAVSYTHLTLPTSDLV